MGKTMSRGRGNSKSKSSAFDFDGKEEQIDVEKYSQLVVDKFKSIPSPNKTTDSSPIDKYTFLQFFSRGNKDEDKKPGTEEVAKSCTSSLEVNVVSSSSDSHSNVSRCNNHNDRCCLSKLNSYSSRGRSSEIVGTSTSSNHREDTQYKFLSDSQLIGITSDDEDSIELNSVSKENCHYVDDEALSAERVKVHGFDGVESDRVIMFLPVNIFIGDEIFWNPQLTLTRNHVKLEAEGSVHDRGPISCEWTTDDIVGIKSVWSKNISHVGLYLHLKSKDGESVINVEDSGIIKLDLEVPYADWQELRNRIWALDSRYQEAWLTDSPVDAVNIEGVLMDKFSSHHFRDADDFVVTFPKGDLDAVSIGWSDVQLLQPKTFINDTIIDFYMNYLLEEWKERRNDLVVDISSRFWDVPFLRLEVPQQQNLFDRGLFLLHYAELFMEEAPENFNYFRILNFCK